VTFKSIILPLLLTAMSFLCAAEQSPVIPSKEHLAMRRAQEDRALQTITNWRMKYFDTKDVVSDTVLTNVLNTNNITPQYIQGYYYLTFAKGKPTLYKGKLKTILLPNVAAGRAKHEDYLACAIRTYKFHLMPQNEEFAGVLYDLFSHLRKDPVMQRCVHEIKIKKDISKILGGSSNHPMIVVYAAAGKEAAQTLLSKLCEIFKNSEYQGTGIRPRFNQKITDLLFFAQGDGDHKQTPENAKFYDENKVYFVVDKDGKPVEPKMYWLKVP